MKKLFLSSFILFLTVFVFAADDCIPSKPSPFQLVNNFSKEFPEFLSIEETEALEQKLQNFNRETSNQIVIAIVDDLCGYDANEFSTRLGEQWGVGQGKFDNGIVIMIKPTGGTGQRDAYITAGYGLEGAIPDATAKRIVENEIITRFKSGDFYSALDAATTILISLAKNEYSYSDYQKQQSWTPFIIAVCIIALFIILSFRKRSYTVGSGGRTYYGRGWSSWGGGGFGSGGSFGGGSFGGGSFGGGSFGGGGAGGKW